MTPCRNCRGYGRVGFLGVCSRPCPRCHGTGTDPRPHEPEVVAYTSAGVVYRQIGEP